MQEVEGRCEELVYRKPFESVQVEVVGFKSQISRWESKSALRKILPVCDLSRRSGDQTSFHALFPESAQFLSSVQEGCL